MATRYRFGDNEKPHFVTFAVIQWIDVFSKECYKEILLESLKYCIAEKGLVLHAWVIMTNHVHLIISAQEGQSQAAIIRDLKKYTSRMIISAIEENNQESRKSWLIRMFKYEGAKNANNKCYQFWQQDNHPIELNTYDRMARCINYIHENPVGAGIVLESTHYKHSSATSYQEGNGLLPIELLV